MKFGVYISYHDKKTFELIKSTKINDYNRKKFIRIVHRGVYDDNPEGVCVSLYTSPSISKYQINKEWIIANNIRNFYFDKYHMNPIKFYDNSFLEYYNFEENPNYFFDFYLKKTENQFLNFKSAVRWAVMEYSRAVYLSQNEGKLLKYSIVNQTVTKLENGITRNYTVEITQTEWVTAPITIKNAITFINQDVLYKEKVVNNLINTWNMGNVDKVSILHDLKSDKFE